ncbi:MAG TPA: alpha/beta fold hydrolase, partial [Herpetosiphonaceae bacterium]|nr:alpha/beta fold hydrolase [Herpetosiphonaceae bacterium]
MQTKIGTQIQRPAWLNPALYPFEGHMVTIDGNHVHYVDEGDGPVLLLLHGNPTWSFLYRDLINALRGVFRCIALDYPGFGLSHAAPNFGCQPDDYVYIVERFVDMLDLRDITLMVQDWGGPIGLHAAARAPERYQALIIGDTRAWPGLPAFERIQSCFMASPLGAYLARKHNLYADLLIPLGHRRRTLSRAELDHYRQPLTSTAARERARRLAGALTDNQPFLAEVERGLARLAHLPALLVWAEHDPGFPRAD